MQYVWSLNNFGIVGFLFSAVYQYIRLTFLFILSQKNFILKALKRSFDPKVRTNWRPTGECRQCRVLLYNFTCWLVPVVFKGLGKFSPARDYCICVCLTNRDISIPKLIQLWLLCLCFKFSSNFSSSISKTFRDDWGRVRLYLYITISFPEPAILGKEREALG
jgi:hypothetical protein